MASLPPHPEDWLILAGDVGDTPAQLEWAFQVLGDRFRQLVWVPGNHELWTLPTDPCRVRGVARYEFLVELCRRHGVLTPEDDYFLWTGDGEACVIAPMFTLYDYSFRPADVARAHAVEWARRAGVVGADEFLLHPDPYDSRDAWCDARISYSERRLGALTDEHRVVLISHFPLRRDLVRLGRIPRFSLWCGTDRTADWHRRFRAAVVVSGHVHVPATDWRDGVRFEEVSLGVPREWECRPAPPRLREILPGPAFGPR
jgi:3',5'-cyclic AMP phosphodiesterase CpdA